MNPYACDVVDLFLVNQGDPEMRLASLQVLDQLELALPVLIGVPHFVIKLITTSSLLIVPQLRQIKARLSTPGCYAAPVRAATRSQACHCESVSRSRIICL